MSMSERENYPNGDGKYRRWTESLILTSRPRISVYMRFRVDCDWFRRRISKRNLLGHLFLHTTFSGRSIAAANCVKRMWRPSRIGAKSPFGMVYITYRRFLSLSAKMESQVRTSVREEHVVWSWVALPRDALFYIDGLVVSGLAWYWVTGVVKARQLSSR